MPIINSSRRAADLPPVRDPVIRAPKPVPGDSPIAQPRESAAAHITSRTLLWASIGLACGVLAPFLVYYGMQARGSSPPAPLNAEPSVTASIDVDADLQRLQKIAAIAALTKKEYEMNTVTRLEAQEKADTMTIAAFDAILDKNRRELAESKMKMAELLAGLHQSYAQSPRDVQQRFEAVIEHASQQDSPEVSRILQLGATAIESVPDGVSPATYFSQALDNNL